MTQVLRGSVAACLGVVLTLLPATVSAQRASEDRVAAAIGKDVTVTLQDGTKHRGRLRSLSTTDVVLDKSTDPIEPQTSPLRDFKLPLNSVSHIQRNSHAMRKGVIIGLVAGLFAGLATFANEGDPDAEEAPEAPPVIAETRTDIPEASVADAVMLLDLRHTTALLFKNAGTGRHNMVYRRADGSIGWVEPS